MSKRSRDLITRKGFKAWLESFPEDEVVGTRGEPNECPISNFVASLLGPNCYVETLNGVVIFQVGPWAMDGRKKADWIGKFVKEVDSVNGFPNPGVTAKEALEILG